MRPHYRKCKGYRRPNLGGRPVYYLRMSREEVRDRRLLGTVIGILAAMIGSGVLWVVSMV